VIQFAPTTRVYLACRPVDLRKGLDGLTAQVANVLQADPFSGHLFIFRGKRGDYFKLVYWDGSGLCLFAKRLEQGRFVWPPIVDGRMRLTPAQMALLVEGIDWRRTVSVADGTRPSAV
jgi:transposase